MQGGSGSFRHGLGVEPVRGDGSDSSAVAAGLKRDSPDDGAVREWDQVVERPAEIEKDGDTVEEQNFDVTHGLITDEAREVGIVGSSEPADGTKEPPQHQQVGRIQQWDRPPIQVAEELAAWRRRDDETMLGQLLKLQKNGIWSKNFVKLNYLTSRVFLAWNFF